MAQTPSRLLQLPLEIRLQIFEYLLPCRERFSNYIATKRSASSTVQLTTGLILQREDGDERRYGRYDLRIMLVSRQCHSDALHIMHNQTYELHIDQYSFPITVECTNFGTDKTHWNLAYVKNKLDWAGFIVDLRLDKVAKLVIDIQLPYFPSEFFSYLKEVLRGLSEHLLGEPLRHLTVNFFDVQVEEDENPYSWRGFAYTWPTPKDYMAALRPLLKDMSMAQKCELHLPTTLQGACNGNLILSDLQKQERLSVIFDLGVVTEDSGYKRGAFEYWIHMWNCARGLL
ncbi:MAG: hypothetical protein Q9191_001666 [Dirinaria sp. TL-2023a]